MAEKRLIPITVDDGVEHDPPECPECGRLLWKLIIYKRVELVHNSRLNRYEVEDAEKEIHCIHCNNNIAKHIKVLWK